MWLWVLTWNNFLINSYLLMEIYMTSLLQILSFSSRFRGFELKNFLCWPFMVTANIIWLVVPPNFFFISSQFINIHDAIRDDVHIHLATLFVLRVRSAVGKMNISAPLNINFDFFQYWKNLLKILWKWIRDNFHY